METVRAATLATARRLERLAAEAEKQKEQSPERKGPVKAKQSKLHNYTVYLTTHKGIVQTIIYSNHRVSLIQECCFNCFAV